MRPVLTLTALYTALIVFVFILGTNTPLAFAIASITGTVLLALLTTRGPETLFAWISGDHPDAKGSLDTEPENTP